MIHATVLRGRRYAIDSPTNVGPRTASEKNGSVQAPTPSGVLWTAPTDCSTLTTSRTTVVPATTTAVVRSARMHATLPASPRPFNTGCHGDRARRHHRCDPSVRADALEDAPS